MPATTHDPAHATDPWGGSAGPDLGHPRPDEPGAGPDRRLGGPLDPGVLVGTTDAEILRCFLDLVRTWRGCGPGHALRLRQADVAVLVTILGTDSAEIERRLVAATACTPKVARRCRRLLLASAAALVLAVVTASPVGSTSTVGPTAPVGLAPPATVVAVARSTPDAGTLGHAVAVAVAAPPAVDAPTTPVAGPAAPEPTVAALPAGTEAIVTIASVGMELAVVSGGQAVIDQGVVAHYTAAGWEPPVPAGAPGTYWLAAHHTTHGGPFGALPDVAVGAEIRVEAGSRTFVYTVTSTEVTGLWPGDDAVYGTDPTASVILLQTCIGSSRLLVHGTLTATR